VTDLKDQLQRTLGTNYAIERELGGGGMSRVFLAEEISLERKVVVKVLPPDLAATVNVERFRREIQLAAKLQHPHIVPVLAAGISEGLPYYTMPFIEGESLRARIARSGELPINEAARILRDVLSALSYAHERGVVHRDMKPDNILLTGHHAVVVDFGVAKALSAATNSGSNLTSLGVALGTPAYMSPEQAAADPNTDHRTDIYGIGALAYEMLTGQQVFSARSPQAMLAAHAIETPEPIDKRRPSVPRALASLVMRSLEKHAADRPQSAGEMLAELEAAVTPSGPSAPSGTTPARRRRQWKKPLIIAGATVAGVVAIASAANLYAARTRLNPDRVIVAPFQNKTGDPQFDQLGSIASDWVIRGITELGVGDVAQFTPARDASGRVSPTDLQVDALTRRARSLGASRVVSGEFYLIGDSLQFQAQLTDASDGEVLGAVSTSTSARGEPMTAINTMRSRVMGALAAAGGIEGTSVAAVSAPPSFAAYREFVRGEDAFRRGAFKEAIDHYRRAASMDTTYVVPLVRMAYSYNNLGECPVTDSIGRILNARRELLSAFEGLYLDRVLAWCRGDWNAAYVAAKRIGAVAPKSNFAQYIAARSAMPINRPRETIKALERMDWKQPHSGGYFDDLTRSLHAVGEHKHELEVAVLHREQHPGRLPAVASAVRALSALGRVDEVRRLVSESLTMPSPDVRTAANVLQIASNELVAHGRVTEGRQVAEQLTVWLRARPPNEQNDTLLVMALLSVGNTAEARSIAKRLVTKHPQDRVAISLDGITAAHAGERQVAERAIVVLDSLSDPYQLAENLFSRALIAAVLGQKERAVEYLRESIRKGLSYVQLNDAIPELLPLRGYAPYDELIRPKG
jgi:serine/threonine-protein kinase